MIVLSIASVYSNSLYHNIDLVMSLWIAEFLYYLHLRRLNNFFLVLRGGHWTSASDLNCPDVLALPEPVKRTKEGIGVVKLHHAAHRVDPNFPPAVEDLVVPVFRCSYPCTEHPTRRAF